MSAINAVVLAHEAWMRCKACGLVQHVKVHEDDAHYPENVPCEDCGGELEHSEPPPPSAEEISEARRILSGSERVLGPAYFEAQGVARRFMAHFQDKHFKPLIDEAADKFKDKLWTDLSSWLIDDTEMNLGDEIRRMVEGTVEALLSGEKWALERHVLYVGRYDSGEKIRAAIAAHIPADVQDKRIADLEAEVKKLSEDNRWLRERS